MSSCQGTKRVRHSGPNQAVADLNDGEEHYIRRRAHRLVGTAGYTAADVDDIAQELRLRLWLALSTYDVDRSRPAYAKAVVERAIATLVERARAAKRGAGLRPQGVDPVDLANMTRSESQAYAVDIHCDVKDALADLDPALQVIAESLKEYSLTQASRLLSMPVSTMRRRKRAIRDQFERKSLQKYI